MSRILCELFEYKYSDKMGSGGEADIFKGTDKRNGNDIVIKINSKRPNPIERAVMNHAADIKLPGVIHCLGKGSVAGFPFVVMVRQWLTVPHPLPAHIRPGPACD